MRARLRTTARTRRALLARGLVALVLGLHLLPSLTPLLAAAGHLGHHLSERLAAEQARYQHLQVESWRHQGTVAHAHGPDGVLHTHGAAVDRLREAAARTGEEEPGAPSTPVELRVDKHLLPAPDLPAAFRLVAAEAPAYRNRFHGSGAGSPPVPPPQA